MRLRSGQLKGETSSMPRSVEKGCVSQAFDFNCGQDNLFCRSPCAFEKQSRQAEYDRPTALSLWVRLRVMSGAMTLSSPPVLATRAAR
jgi:hypothetical protein